MLECTGQISTNAQGQPICSGEWVSTNFQALLESIFATPPEVEIQAAFMAGFATPMIAYLTAWAFQTVINFVKRG
ncbi:hypothetical protein [Cellvibrio sp. UBA7661]|uniref:hypothetical protein n=1 Tax=Cellvibrio sp. UBA7661 TaxID=1946311 RepID=UPI002F357678